MGKTYWYTKVSINHELLRDEVNAHQDIVIDCLSLTVGADSQAGLLTLETIRRVREEYGLAYAVYCYNQGYRDCGIMTVYAATAPPTAEQTRDLILSEVKALNDDGPDESEIRRCKETIKGHIL